MTTTGADDPARRSDEPARPPEVTGPPAPAVPERPGRPGRPERSADDSDLGWGERAEDSDDADRRYLEDRPPHWGSD